MTGSISVRAMGSIAWLNRAVDRPGASDRFSPMRSRGAKIVYHLLNVGRRSHHGSLLPFNAMNTPVLVDCEPGTILDSHGSTKRPHDTQVGWQVLSRNLDRLSVITAAKGDDATDLPRFLRANQVKPVIIRNAHGPLTTAHNRLEADQYANERPLRRRFGSSTSGLVIDYTPKPGPPSSVNSCSAVPQQISTIT